VIKGSFEKRFYLTVLCFDTLHWYGVLAQSIGEDALVEVVSGQGRTVWLLWARTVRGPIPGNQKVFGGSAADFRVDGGLSAPVRADSPQVFFRGTKQIVFNLLGADCVTADSPRGRTVRGSFSSASRVAGLPVQGFVFSGGLSAPCRADCLWFSSLNPTAS